MAIGTVNKMVETLIDAKVAGQILQFSPRTVRAMARAGELPAVIIQTRTDGRAVYRFRVSELEAWLQGRAKRHSEAKII